MIWIAPHSHILNKHTVSPFNFLRGRKRLTHGETLHEFIVIETVPDDESSYCAINVCHPTLAASYALRDQLFVSIKAKPSLGRDACVIEFASFSLLKYTAW